MIGKVELLFVVALAACGTDADAIPQLTYRFGPFAVDPGGEQTDLCVAVTLHNQAPLYVNSVAMVGAPGLHHSNWFWVPNNDRWNGFPEGSFSCAAGNGTRPFDQQVAAVDGGVLFAQSTQAPSDTQEFPVGAAIRIEPNARIIADIHLLNVTDASISVPLDLTLSQIAEHDVTSLLHGFSMENLAIALPPPAKSKFVVECDLGPSWQNLYSLHEVTSDHVDFKFFHALAHYHKLGTGLTFEAIRDSDGGADTIWTTKNGIGDELGGMLAPPFDMTGHSKVRLTCEYDNPNSTTISWGNGAGEMCIAFAYTDSTYTWTAGQINTTDDPGAGIADNGTFTFTAPKCSGVVAVPNG